MRDQRRFFVVIFACFCSSSAFSASSSTFGPPEDGHYGIRGMCERAQEIGAQFNIQSRLHAGTEIEVIVLLT